MTKSAARTTANVILGVAGLAAACVVWTRPPLRRTALKAARWWLGAGVPAYLLGQVRHAWVESAHSA